MNNPFWEILIIFLLLIANGVFAMAEIAVVSSRKVRLKKLANEGNKRAQSALELASNPNQFLATVQIGITMVGILAGAFGGATIASKLGVFLNSYPLLSPYGDLIGIGLIVIALTYLSLVIGELVPKRVALNSPERIASIVASPMKALSRIALAPVWLLTHSSNIVLRLLNIRPSTEPPVTEEEIKLLIEQGTQMGVFEEVEQDMIEGVLQLADRHVSLLMTPRKQIVSFDLDDPPERIQRKLTKSNHSRFPVINGTLETILGIVRAKDLLAQCLAGRAMDLKTMLRPPLYVPEGMSILKLLEIFKQEKTHIALVIDEYGGIQGLVTHDDILESIVGDIPSVGEPWEPQANQREDGSWLLDGMLHIDKLKEIFDFEELPSERQGLYQTVGGFVISQVKRIPYVGQFFEWGNVRFEVVDMDGRRVDKVLAARIGEDARS
ncbi:MAG: HlyC/CorC family transporter [Deltaproteobacteria bacterium]|nr:HlyC/CorC family transporter [Deltaproteobacteria bacterium]